MLMHFKDKVSNYYKELSKDQRTPSIELWLETNWKGTEENKETRFPRIPEDNLLFV